MRSGTTLSAPIVLIMFGVGGSAAFGQAALTGVSLAGAEFGEHSLPGTYGTHYTYPTTDEVDYFVGLGMNVFRLPFRWERLQRAARAELDATELARMDAFVEYATAQGAKVVLDPHNYARYFGDVIGSAALPADVFADFWRRLAMHYSDNEDVIFGLMNEPHTMPTEQWLEGANAAIAAIRDAGAENLILVPGNGWTGAHSWSQSWYGTPNATLMQGIVDPLDQYAIELHQYLDGDSSGTSPDCVNTTVGVQRLQGVTSWLRAQGLQGFLGEFGVAANATCLTAMANLLDYLDANTDAWLGWTYWAAGPWWSDYMYSIEPDAQGNDRPQTAVLREHLASSVSVEDGLPEAPALALSVYPSVVRDRATLAFDLLQPGQIAVDVFDVLGRRVRTLDAGVRAPGSHTLMLDAAGLSAGTYLVRLRTADAVRTRSVVVVR